MRTVFALLCFVVVIHWLIFPYPSGLLHWHCGNLTIAPVPAKQPWWIWINTSCEFIMNDCITTTKQSTTKPCAYFLGCSVDTLSITIIDGRYQFCCKSKSQNARLPSYVLQRGAEYWPYLELTNQPTPCHTRKRKCHNFDEIFIHWLHQKLSFRQLSVQPVMKISLKWQNLRFSTAVSYSMPENILEKKVLW